MINSQLTHDRVNMRRHYMGQTICPPVYEFWTESRICVVWDYSLIWGIRFYWYLLIHIAIIEKNWIIFINGFQAHSNVNPNNKQFKDMIMEFCV